MTKLNTKKFLKHKYHAKPTEVDGIKFGSMKEARYYGQLKMLKMAGEVIFFLRQVPFEIGAGITYRLDFMEFHSDQTIHYVEIKGFETKVWKIKKKLVESLYPIKIEVK